MGKIFSVYASQGPNNYVELDLPASDYEMLDLMERLRLEPGQLPYLEILRYDEKYDYLEKCIQDLPDIYQLNALARKLAGFTSVQDMASFEGLVGKEMERGAVTIELPKLIDFAHSIDCCYVAEGAETDFQLGKFLVENDFIEEANGLSESMLALLDFGKIGREHREQEDGVYTSFGYVEQHSEIHHVNETMDFQPRKPDYTILLNMAALPLNERIRDADILQMKLPAPAERMQEVMEKLGVNDWNDVVVSILDCAVPERNHEMYLDGEVPQIMELAQCLKELDARGEMPKYKALLAAKECSGLIRMIALAGTVDEYILNPRTSCPEDVAMSELRVMIGNTEADDFAQYVNLQAFGLSLLERDHAVITGYGLIERQDGQPIQTMEQKTEGMVMT